MVYYCVNLDCCYVFILWLVMLQYLDCLWAQICTLRRNDWVERQIERPYLAFDAMLSDALQHPIPPLMPPAHDDDQAYPLPWVVYRMFDHLDVPEVSAIALIRSHILLLEWTVGSHMSILWYIMSSYKIACIVKMWICFVVLHVCKLPYELTS